MADVDQALKRVQAAAKRLAKAQEDVNAARSDLYQQLRNAQATRATWDEMMAAGSVSRVTLSKALKQ